MNAAEVQLAAVVPELFADAPLRSPRTKEPDGGQPIQETRRNDTLTRLAGSMRRKGFTQSAIAAALAVVNKQQCHPPLAASEVEAIAHSVARYQPANQPDIPTLVGLTLPELAAHSFPERRPILTRFGTVVLRAGDLAQLYGARGLGKTWLSQTLALTAATGASALGFDCPAACRVVYINGEDSSREIQERFAHLCRFLRVDPPEALRVVAADWQASYLPRLDSPEGQQAIEPFIDPADMIIADNRSCLFDPDGEKDASAWQAAQDWLLSLRRRGKAVIFAHHANRAGSARGHSKAEDPLNLIIGLSRPEGYQQDQGARFNLTFEKSRGAHGDAVAPFCAKLTPTGWEVEDAPKNSGTAENRLLEYVRLATRAGEPPKSANAVIAGTKINKNRGLEAWANLLASGSVVPRQGKFYAY